MTRSRAALGVLALIALLSGCGRDGGTAPQGASAPTGAGARPVIAVIPKGTTHVFWQSVERGARRAGEELGAEIVYKGPLMENDRAQQIQVVQSFIARQVDAIVLAPLDFKALVGPVASARERRIPVVIFDSALDGEAGRDFVSLVATDNLKGGRLAGEHLLGLLGGTGKVVLLRYLVGSASTEDRERGFLEVVRPQEGIRMLIDNRYAGATAGEAKEEALAMIERIAQANGIFCSNESATLGMLLALRQQGLAGRIRFVGFDASPPLVEALRQGEIDALVVQDPDTMGYRAVETAVRHRRGEPVEPIIDTGAVLVTRDNLSEPAVAKLISEEQLTTEAQRTQRGR